MRNFKEYTVKTLYGNFLSYLGDHRVEIPESAFNVSVLKERLKAARRSSEWSPSQPLNYWRRTNIWDFKSALGDTVSEKNESLYVKMHECRRSLFLSQMKPDHYWLVVSKRMFDIMQGTSAFKRLVDGRLRSDVAQMVGYWGGFMLYVMGDGLAMRSWGIKHGRVSLREDVDNIIIGCGGIRSNKPCERIAVTNFNW